MLWLIALASANAPLSTISDPTNPLIASVAEGVHDTPVSTAVRLLLTLTAMSFLPGMLLVMTPFVRFVVVLSMLRQALGMNQSPPNQVIVGLSLFLSLLVMEPSLTLSYHQGMQPFLEGTMSTTDAWTHTIAPLRDFMLANTRKADMMTMLQIANMPRPESLSELSTALVTSAFVLSELKTAMVISVYVFVPFLVIDLVTSSVLMGLGMMMLPPTTISLPFKLMVFVLTDGWGLLVRDMVQGIAR
jgi:flagellar biosynthetic protein FliP